MNWRNIYNMEQLGTFLKRTRQEKGLNQIEYSEMIGVSHATLSSLENGKSVSTATLERALQFLGLRLIVLPKADAVNVIPDDTQEQPS